MFHSQYHTAATGIDESDQNQVPKPLFLIDLPGRFLYILPEHSGFFVAIRGTSYAPKGVIIDSNGVPT